MLLRFKQQKTVKIHLKEPTRSFLMLYKLRWTLTSLVPIQRKIKPNLTEHLVNTYDGYMVNVMAAHLRGAAYGTKVSFLVNSQTKFKFDPCRALLRKIDLLLARFRYKPILINGISLALRIGDVESTVNARFFDDFCSHVHMLALEIAHSFFIGDQYGADATISTGSVWGKT